MNKLTKIFGVAAIAIFCVTHFAFLALAAVDTDYVPLTTVPGAFQQGVRTNPVTVVAGIYGLAIGIGSVIAVIMIIVAGFQYMYQESIDGKSDAKQRIMNAFIGLFVMLGSYILLKTINPDLVNFDVTLQGSRTGKLAFLVATTQQLDAANTNAAITLSKISALNEELSDLQKKQAVLNASVSALKTEDETNPAYVKALADLDAVNADIRAKTVARATLQTTADQRLALSKIDQNLIQLGPGGAAKAANGNIDQSIVVNIDASQTGVDKLFEKTLSELKALDQNDPQVKSAIAATEARKESMEAEFAQQRAMNAIYNPTASQVSGGTGLLAGQLSASTQELLKSRETIVAKIQADTAVYVEKLKKAGLPAEAGELQTRSQERLSALCLQAKLCGN